MLRVGDYNSTVKGCLGAPMKYNGEKRADFRRPATSAGSSLLYKTYYAANLYCSAHEKFGWPEAKCIVPYWGIYCWLLLRDVVPAHVAWRAGTTTLCQSWLYPPSQGPWIWLLTTTSPILLWIISGGGGGVGNRKCREILEQKGRIL